MITILMMMILSHVEMQLASQMKHPEKLIELLRALSKKMHHQHHRLHTLELHSTRPLPSLPHIIAACPDVTQLSYAVMPFSVAYRPKLLPMDTGDHVGLTTLRIDTKETSFDLYAILQHCPSLLRLKVNLMVQLDYHAILKACPSIQVIHSGPFNMLYDYDTQPYYYQQSKDGDDDDDPCYGVRHLVLHEYRQDRIKNLATLDFILEQHTTLELLHLELEGLIHTDWDHLVSRLPRHTFHRLKTLCCRSLYGCRGRHIAALITACPNLEHLHLCRMHQLDPPVWRSLLSLRSLRKLELCIENPDVLMDQQDQQAAAARHHQHVVSGGILPWFFQTISRPNTPSLRYLSLSSMGSLLIDSAVLLAVASIRTLEDLTLEGVERMLVPPQVMAQFLTRLQQHGTLEHLALIRVTCMDIGMLDILFGMSHLKTLKMDKCKSLTAEVLEQWLEVEDGRTWNNNVEKKKMSGNTPSRRPLFLHEIKVDDRIIASR